MNLMLSVISTMKYKDSYCNNNQQNQRQNKNPYIQNELGKDTMISVLFTLMEYVVHVFLLFTGMVEKSPEKYLKSFTGTSTVTLILKDSFLL